MAEEEKAELDFIEFDYNNLHFECIKGGMVVFIVFFMLMTKIMEMMRFTKIFSSEKTMVNGKSHLWR